MLYSKSWSSIPSDLATRPLKEAPEAPAEPVQPDGPAMTEQVARIQNFDVKPVIPVLGGFFLCLGNCTSFLRRKRRI